MFEDRIEAMNRETETASVQMPEKRVYSVAEIQDILGIGRNSAYEVIKNGKFRVVRIGNQIRISRKSFDEWLDQMSEDCQVCDFEENEPIA